VSASVRTANGSPPSRTVLAPYSAAPGNTPGDKIVPFNIEAEEAVLGSLLLDSQAIVNVASFLRPDDFYREKNRWVYDAALALYARREAIDFLTIGDEMERHGVLDAAGGRSFLTALMNAVPTSIHIEYYARIVERASVRRRLIKVAGDIAQLAYEEADELDTTLQKAQNAFLTATQRQVGGAQPIAQVLETMWQPVTPSAPVKVLSTGYLALDKMTAGLKKGELIIGAGRPGMGKSAFLTNLAAHVALGQGATVLYASQEMNAEQLTQRQVAVEGCLDLNRMIMGELDPDEYQRQLQAEARVYSAPIHYFCPGLLSVENIRAEAIKLKLRGGIALVLVDYIQLIARAQGNKSLPEVIGQVTQGLKSLAMELEIPVVAASQISREVEKTSDRRPLLSHLGWSGAIEADADKVLLLYRHRYYDKTSTDHTVEVDVAKHRNGPTGMVRLYYHEEWTKLDPL
jgi:replicative DNA helicase